MMKKALILLTGIILACSLSALAQSKDYTLNMRFSFSTSAEGADKESHYGAYIKVTSTNPSLFEDFNIYHDGNEGNYLHTHSIELPNPPIPTTLTVEIQSYESVDGAIGLVNTTITEIVVGNNCEYVGQDDGFIHNIQAYLVPNFQFDRPVLKKNNLVIGDTVDGEVISNKLCGPDVLTASSGTVSPTYKWEVSRTGTSGWETIAWKASRSVNLSAFELHRALSYAGERFNSTYYVRVSSGECNPEGGSEPASIASGSVVFYPSAPVPNMDILPPSCHGDGDASITINSISGGSGTYYVTVAPYYTNTALCDDANDVDTIKFWNGTDSVDVTVCNPIYAYNFTYEPAVDGPLVITQGTETLEIQKDGTDGEVPATISMLPAGYYRLTIENSINKDDEVGCFYANDFLITDPPPLAFSSAPNPSSYTYTTDAGGTLVTSLRCEADEGWVTVEVDGGSGVYDFDLTNASGSLVDVVVDSLGSKQYKISGIPSGRHALTLLDDKGCSLVYPDSVEMTAPTPLQASAELAFENCQYVYTVNKTGGVGSGSYTYALTSDDSYLDSLVGNKFYFNRALSVPPSLSITDIGNFNEGETSPCTFNVSVPENLPALVDPVIPTIAEDDETQPSCVGDSNGEVQFSISGVAPFQAELFESASDTPLQTETVLSEGAASFGNLSANISYTIRVTDVNGCSANSNTFLLSDPEPVSLAIAVPYYTYFGDITANVPLTVSGGTPFGNGNYEFELSKNGSIQSTLIAGGGNDYYYTDLEYAAYQIRTNDRYGCSDSSTVTVAPHPYITHVQPADVYCFGGTNGTITFKVNWTDTINYTLYLDNVELSPERYEKIADSTYTISGLAEGVYQLKVAESTNPVHNYTYASDISIGQADDIRVAFAIKEADCQGGSEGSYVGISSISGGNGAAADWSYTWYRGSCGEVLIEGDTLASTDTLFNVPAGSYAVIMRDSLGCTKCIDEKIVPETPELTFSADPILQSCEAVEDGRFDLNQIIERPFYRLYLNGNVHPIDSVDQAPWAFDSLAEGEYVIELEDLDKGCLAYDTLSIGVRTLTLTIDATRNVSCYGGADGYLLAHMSGGVESPTYTLRNLLTEEDTLFSGEAYWLTAGYYQVLATANEGCFVLSDTIVITQPEELLVTATEDRSAYCGNANGAVSAAISGGTAPFRVRWSPVGGGPTPDTTALLAGTYLVEVTDARDCQAWDTVSVRNLVSDIQLTTATTAYICEEEGGSLRMTLNGEAAPFRLALLAAGTSDTLRLFEGVAAGAPFTASALQDGIYTLKVSDSRGCTFTTTDTIAYNPIVVSMAATVESTCGQANGSYTIALSGGAEPYSWNWSPNVPAAEGLQAGNLHADSLYFVDVSDAGGCVSRHHFQVGNADGPSIRLVAADSSSYCGQPSGAATVEGSGGNGTLTYNWSLSDGTPYASGPALTSIDTLRANTYTIRVRDETGCLSGSILFTVTDEPALLLSLSLRDSTACSLPLGRAEASISGGEGPYTYRWFYASGADSGQVVAESAIAEGLFARQYRVEGTDSRGCTQSASIYIPEKADPQIWESATEEASCGLATGWAEAGSRGGTGAHHYVWQDAEGNTLPDTTARAEALSRGSYTVYAVDANGCTSATIPVEIGEKTSLAIYQAANLAASCAEGADGVLEVRIEGGAAPYAYRWNDAAAQTTARAVDLAAGEYIVEVTDAAGCTATRSFTVDAPAAISISGWSVELPACTGEANGSLSARVEGGTAPYTYAWYTEEGALLEGQTSATARGLSAGTYTLTVSDSKGCLFSGQMELPDREPVTTTGIPSGAIICNGQTYVLDAGSGWQSYNWSSELGFSSNSRRVELTHAGLYYLEAVNARGCVVQDTFLLEVSNDALTADFLMASSGYVGDTLVLIDISWPVPTHVNWQYAREEGVEVITNEDFVQEVIFTEPGTYTVGLDAFLAECIASVSKQITIEEAGAAPPDAGGRKGGKDLIYSTKVYPNPSRGRFKVEVELTENAPLRLEVLSLYTAEVLHAVAFENKRKVEVPLDLAQLTDGLYLLRIVAGDSYKNIRFYIQH